MSQPDFLEDNILSFFEGFPMESIECTIEVEKFISREIFVEVGILWHESDPFPHGNIIDGTAEELHFSVSRLHDTENTLHGRRLSRAIRTEKSEDFSFLDRERQIIEEEGFPDFFREVCNLDDRMFRGWVLLVIFF